MPRVLVLMPIFLLLFIFCFPLPDIFEIYLITEESLKLTMHLSSLKFEAIHLCLPSAKTLDMGYRAHSMLIFQISD